LVSAQIAPLQACVQKALFARERTGDETPIRKARHRLAVDVEGFNLNATTTIQGTDRTTLVMTPDQLMARL
jgi:hypothetical protein